MLKADYFERKESLKYISSKHFSATVSYAGMPLGFVYPDM